MSWLQQFWTAEDAAAAKAEGWQLFPGDARICPDDATTRSAILEQAQSGSALHVKALMLTMLWTKDARQRLGPILAEAAPVPEVVVRLSDFAEPCVEADRYLHYTIVDYAVGDTPREELYTVPQEGGGVTEARVQQGLAFERPEAIAELLAQLSNEEDQRLALDGMTP